MNVQEFAEQLKNTIQKQKEQGLAAIPCDSLISYLDAFLKSSNTPDVDLECHKACLQVAIEQEKDTIVSRQDTRRARLAAENASDLEMFRSVITATQSAIRSSLILNGGAALALLAFIGHLATIKSGNIESFATVLLWFTAGALAITIVSGFTYLSQMLYSTEKDSIQKWGDRLKYFCIVLAISSYGCFIIGMCYASSAFSNFV